MDFSAVAKRKCKLFNEWDKSRRPGLLLRDETRRSGEKRHRRARVPETKVEADWEIFSRDSEKRGKDFRVVKDYLPGKENKSNARCNK